MKYLTNLQIILKAAKGMIRQNKKSESVRNTECKYYGPNGLHCAVGFLIPPSKYTKKIEGKSVKRSFMRGEADPLLKVLMNSKVNVTDKTVSEILGGLQHIHDGCNVDEWSTGLDNLAQTFLSKKEYKTYREEIAKVKPKKD